LNDLFGYVAAVVRNGARVLLDFLLKIFDCGVELRVAARERGVRQQMQESKYDTALHLRETYRRRLLSCAAPVVCLRGLAAGLARMEYFNTAGSADKNSGGKEYTTLGRKRSGFGELRACATLKSPTQRDEIQKDIGKDKGHPGSRRDGKVFRGMQARGVGAGRRKRSPGLGKFSSVADSVVAAGVACVGEEDSPGHFRAARAECALI